MRNPYNIGLDKNLANFQPLTPLSLLARTVAVYPHLTSTLYDGRSFTRAETYDRCRRLASCLVALGIGEGDTVAAMLPNVPAMHELHFAVPMAGAVMNTLNLRLDAASLAFQLDHGSELKDGASVTDNDIIAFCREHISGFKAPKAVVFGPLPKTSTGKIQKFMLRSQLGSTTRDGCSCAAIVCHAIRPTPCASPWWTFKE